MLTPTQMKLLEAELLRHEAKAKAQDDEKLADDHREVATVLQIAIEIMKQLDEKGN